VSKARTEEEAPRVPLWIVTFTDMTTNLLTFFVLLLSLGQIRDDSLFDEGQRISLLFLESVKAGFGFRVADNFEHDKMKYSVEAPELPKGVTKDAREEQTRRLFDTLRRSMQTMPSQLKGSRVEFSVANVRFAPGQASLDEAGMQWLSQYGLNVRQNLDPATTMLYVVGVAGSEAAEAQSRRLAAQQSQAVAAYLRQILSAPSAAQSMGATGAGAPWRVFWWGAGPGSSWAGQDSPNAGQSQILIGAMKTGR
jgi:outer membrane protein OmpA-like peptidoglycan-associated protein